MLGALVDLGVEKEVITSALKKLPIDQYSISWEKTVKKGIASTFCKVECAESNVHRHLKDVVAIIEQGDISISSKQRAVNMFTRLAEAEAKVHGTSVNKIHFHEVGAVDAIIDIVGTAVAVDHLGDVTFIGSPVRTGFGTIEIAHGTYPVPAPGTAGLLKNVPCYAGEFEGEWTTPTGATILTELCSKFEQMPAMEIKAIGYGAGGRDHAHLPNVLRLISGNIVESKQKSVIVIEAQIDDMNPQIVGHLQELFNKAGALDWYTTPVQMKKNRPGFLLTVLCRQEQREKIAQILFSETTTIGYRYYPVEREELERTFESVDTPFGSITIKIAYRNGEIANAAPEFEDCRLAAEKHNVPLKTVQESALKAWHDAEGK